MIEAIDLTKRYDDGRLALDVLNLKVELGEVYCLLGANGAGKTTVINLFLNFIEPSWGKVLINGIDVSKNPIDAKRHISYVSENVMLYGDLTALQNLEFFAKLGGKTGLKTYEYRTVLREVGLPENTFETRVKELSRGIRQRLGIAVAIIRDAPAMLLDEPTSGLDPKAVSDIIGLLNDLRERGKAILLCTHDIFRAKDIATRVGIMKDGRKVLERTHKELMEEDLQALYLDYMSGGYTAGTGTES